MRANSGPTLPEGQCRRYRSPSQISVMAWTAAVNSSKFVGGLIPFLSRMSLRYIVMKIGISKGMPTHLKGATPAELPVQQPAKFELVVSLKAARSIRCNIYTHAIRARRRSNRIAAIDACCWRCAAIGRYVPIASLCAVENSIAIRSLHRRARAALAGRGRASFCLEVDD